jgi:hypothetical protein
MTGVKTLVLLAVTVLSLGIPALVSAQRVPPHVFLGTAIVSSGPAQDGTSVSAFIDDEQVGTAVVANGAYEALFVEQPEGVSYAGKQVTFTIGGFPAAESLTWIQGELTELNLTLAPPVVPTPTPQPEPTPQPVVLPEKGDKGDQGEKGDEGDSGPMGFRGEQGPGGPAGPPGQSGQAGPSGPAGPAGPSGSSGPAGAQGPQGLIGPESSSGGGSTIAILALVFSLVAVALAGGRIAWNWMQES